MTKAHTSLNERNQSEKAKQKSRKTKYKLYQKKKKKRKSYWDLSTKTKVWWVEKWQKKKNQSLVRYESTEPSLHSRTGHSQNTVDTWPNWEQV